jgi:hypothetical protein
LDEPDRTGIQGRFARSDPEFSVGSAKKRRDSPSQSSSTAAFFPYLCDNLLKTNRIQHIAGA